MRKPDEAAQEMTLHALREAQRNPHPDAERRTNGSTGLVRMANLEARMEEQEWQKMLGRYNSVLEPDTEKVEQADGALDLSEDQLDKWFADLRSGRLSWQDAINNIRGIEAVFAECQADYDAVSIDAVRLAEFIQEDPADFQAEELERFPSLFNSLPRITDAWLTGEDDSDPLAPAPAPDDSDRASAAARIPRMNNPAGDE